MNDSLGRVACFKCSAWVWEHSAKHGGHVFCFPCFESIPKDELRNPPDSFKQVIAAVDAWNASKEATDRLAKYAAQEIDKWRKSNI